MGSPFENQLSRAVDTQSSALTTVDISISDINNGNLFSVSKQSVALAASSWLDLQIVTPSSSSLINIQAGSSVLNPVYGIIRLANIYINTVGLAQIQLIEKPSTFTMGTSYISPINRNRNSASTALTICAGDPTLLLTTSSTFYSAMPINEYFGTTVANSYAFGELWMDRNPMLLKYATTHVLRLSNLSTGTCYASMTVYFKEG